MSASAATRRSVADKMILASGAASLALCSGNYVEGAIIASPNAPIGPPTSAGNNLLDVDGDGTNDFQLSNDSSNSASLIESNGGRFVATFSATSAGFAKLPSGFVVGPTMFGAKFFSNPQSGIGVTGSSEIGSDAGQQGWSMGQSGYFGFKFTSGANTFYGWGEIVLAPALSGTRGHGFQFSRLYYENTGAPIAIGDTGGAIPEPSTCALALLAAGGVAAYRARRKVAAV